jgi:alkylated DNA repair dioxygenase AlkB
MKQALPFETPMPDGFRYAPDLLDAAEEQQLIEHIRQVEFASFEMRGVVAKRRVAFFGRTYDAARGDVPDMPAFLLPLRTRAAGWAGFAPERFVMALINEYPAGAPIGWHRDAPQYGVVVGVSLLSPCRMTFRPYVTARQRATHRSPRRATHEIQLEPRSVYLLDGVARSGYEHHIPAVDTLRYSVTFRTVRRPRSDSTSPA